MRAAGAVTASPSLALERKGSVIYIFWFFLDPSSDEPSLAVCSGEAGAGPGGSLEVPLGEGEKKGARGGAGSADAGGGGGYGFALPGFGKKGTGYYYFLFFSGPVLMTRSVAACRGATVPALKKPPPFLSPSLSPPLLFPLLIMARTGSAGSGCHRAGS